MSAQPSVSIGTPFSSTATTRQHVPFRTRPFNGQYASSTVPKRVSSEMENPPGSVEPYTR